MAEWVTLSREESREFLNRRGVVRRQPHAMSRKVLHWPYCARCGLVSLRNEATRLALRAACAAEEDT